MIGAEKVYDAIQLAEASYTFLDDVSPRNSDQLNQALQNRGIDGEFSASQALALVNNWSLANHLPNTPSGFSATLFERKGNSSELVLALRGTELTRQPILDLAKADLGGIILEGIAINQIRDLYNYWKRLTALPGTTVRLARIVSTSDPNASGIFATLAGGTPSNPQVSYRRIEFFDQPDSGLGVITGPVSSLTVTGHSLGGHLSTAFSRLFPDTNAEVVTVNGMGTRENAIVTAFFDALAERTNTSFDTSRIANIFGSAGSNLAAGELLYTQQGVRSEILTESASLTGASALLGHGGEQMTDSAAVYDLLVRVDGSLKAKTPSEVAELLRGVFNAASPSAQFTLESVVNALGRLFLPDYQPILSSLKDDREALYARVKDLVAAISPNNTATLIPLVGKDAVTIEANAFGDIGYRYALKELNPFAVTDSSGALYARFHSGGANAGELDIYNSANGTGTLTSAWIADRAEMLGWRNLYYQKDGNVALRGDRIETLQFTDKSIKDDRTGQDVTLTVVGRNSLQINNPAKIIFGGDADEILLGGNIAAGDHLYGGGGADVLQGNQGNDYLEGGSGNDTYVWNTGDGFDTILDTDGVGRLVVNGKTISGGIRVAQGDYVSADKQILMHSEGDPVTGGVLLVNGDLRIENFTSGDLGIVLNEQGNLAEIQPTTTTFQGPVQTSADFFGSDGADRFVATFESSLFVAKGGDDLLQVSDGALGPRIAGGSGRDLLIGGGHEGVASVLGEAGQDILIGGDHPDQLVGDFLGFEFTDFAFRDSSFSYDETPTEDPDEVPIPGGYFTSPIQGINDTNIFFAGGYFQALKYVLGIDDATDISSYYDDYLDGGGGTDFLFGSYGSDVLFGGAGDDSIDGDAFGLNFNLSGFRDSIWRDAVTRLFGQPGDDYLDGGAGNDRLVDQGGGNDVLIGGPGNDVISSNDPVSSEIGYSDYLEGGEGNDRLFSLNRSLNGHNTLVGGPGDDRLTIQFGSAFFEGGLGSDNYVYFPSSANKLVIDDHDDGGSLDRLYLVPSFGVPFPSSDLVPARDEANLYLSFGGMQEPITVLNWFAGNGYKIEQIIIGGFTSPEGSDVITLLPGARIYDVAMIESRFTTSTDGADFLWGIRGDDQILAGGGNDTLTGNEGNDTLEGGEGDDHLIGGIGNDALLGGVGDDTYEFRFGDGIDTILDAAGFDTLLFGEGITPDMLTLGLGSLMIRVGEGGDTIHVEGFNPSDVFGSSVIENFSFSDGSTLSYNDLFARGFDLTGTASNDTISGTNISDRIDGGAGNDVLIGGAGRDTYFFSLGSGQDVIEDFDTTGFDIDRVRVGAGATPADITVTRAGDFITLALNGTSDQLSMRWQPQAGYQIERVEFADGTIWDPVTLEGLASSGQGNAAPQVANPIADQAALEDATFYFTVPGSTFADSDGGDALTYSATLTDGSALPSWLTFDAATRTFSGTPANEDVGTVGVKVTATDTGNLSVFDTFDVTIANTNDAPTVANAISDQNATEDAAFSFTVPTNTFADVDAGDTLTHSATLADGSALPAWLTFNAAARTFSGTPGNEDVGRVGVKVTATDGASASVSDVFDLTVANTNDTPVLGHPIADQSASTGVAFDFTLAIDAFPDIDRGDVLAYRATLANGDPLPAWLSFDAASRNFSGTPAASDIGAISIRVTASDLAGASATDGFQLVVSGGGECLEMDMVGSDHCDNRVHDHEKRDDERHGKPDSGKRDDRDDDRSDHKGDRTADCLAAYVESKPRYDFEALGQELERSERHGEALNAQEIARRWQVVGRYASGLSHEHDEDARSGAVNRSNEHGLLGGGASGGGFGYAGSTGMAHGIANLRPLQGLEEGFQRLHNR